MEGNLIQTDQQWLLTSFFRSHFGSVANGLNCVIKSLEKWNIWLVENPEKWFFLSRNVCLTVQKWDITASSKRNALKQQSACMCCCYFTFSGLKKHFSALCVFFFPLPGLPPNRRDIESTCKKVLVCKRQLAFALTNTYLLTFQDWSPISPTLNSETRPSRSHQHSPLQDIHDSGVSAA